MTKKMKIVHVRWEDASFFNYAEDRTSVRFTPYLVNTVGFLVERSKEGVIVAHDWMENEDRIKHTTHIPKKYIVSVVELGEAIVE